MRIPGGSHPVHRDWFGLDGFLPGPRFTRDGALLYLLETVGSTNDFLRGRGGAAPGRLCAWDGWGWRAQQLEELPPVKVPRPGTVVVARRQTRGRGRQGRSWVDCDGLHLSVVVPGHRASFDRGFSVWLGLQTVLSLREDFSIDARLKWPNDITVGSRKLGGILLETAGRGDQAVIVAGLGLNIGARLDQMPTALHGSATSVRMVTGHAPRPGDVAGRVLARVEAGLDALRTRGLGAVPPRAGLPGLPAGPPGHRGGGPAQPRRPRRGAGRPGPAGAGGGRRHHRGRARRRRAHPVRRRRSGGGLRCGCWCSMRATRGCGRRWPQPAGNGRGPAPGTAGRCRRSRVWARWRPPQPIPDRGCVIWRPPGRPTSRCWCRWCPASIRSWPPRCRGCGWRVWAATCRSGWT